MRRDFSPAFPELASEFDQLAAGREGITPGWEPRLLDWIDALPPASRAVITLHYLEQMSLDEVATVLEISPGTVKSRLAYGLARLRKEVARSQVSRSLGLY